MRTIKPQPSQGRHRGLRNSRRHCSVRGSWRRGTIMIFVLGVLVLLALIGLLLIARTHTESKRVSYEAAASSGTAAIDDVVNLVRQTLRDDIWGAIPPDPNDPNAMPLSNNRSPGSTLNPAGLLENNEAYDAPGPDDRWLASTVPYYALENDSPPDPQLPYPFNLADREASILGWYRVSYLGNDIIQSPKPFRYSVNSRPAGPAPAYADPKDPNRPSSLRNVWVLQTPPPGITGNLIPGSTTNVTIAVARRWWETNDPLATTGAYRFPYFDTNRDGIVDLYDADGDGVPDSPISFVVPVKSSEPNAAKELYAVIRIVDHASMLNVNVASSLWALRTGGLPTLMFDETSPDRQRRGRRLTDLLLDETVHAADSFSANDRTAGLVDYRWNAPATLMDPRTYDEDIVRRKLVSGSLNVLAEPPYRLYGLQDEASLRRRGMLVPPDRVGDRNPTGNPYCTIDRALPETLLWSRMPDSTDPGRYDPNTPRWNRLNSNYVAGLNTYEGYDDAYGAGWRRLLRDDDPLAIRRPAFTTVSHEVVPSPAGVTLDNSGNSVTGLSANPIQIVSDPTPQNLYMSWPVLDRASYPNVPDHMRVLPIDINMSNPNDSTGGLATKRTFIQYMAAAMYLALNGVSSYQGFPLRTTGGFPQAQLNREYLTWQFAANMADYRDSDGDPTIIRWNYDPNDPNLVRYIFGVEKQPFFTEAYARRLVRSGDPGSGGPSDHSEPPADTDKWFFAVELYVPPLWKIPEGATAKLWLHPTGLASDPSLIPLGSFTQVSDGSPLRELHGGTGETGNYYVLCGSTADPPTGLDMGPGSLFYSNNGFTLWTIDGKAGVELVWSPSGRMDDQLNRVLDVIDPANTNGKLIAPRDPNDPYRGQWAWSGEGSPIPGSIQQWSMLRSTKGWRFTTGWQVLTRFPQQTGGLPPFWQSLGRANVTSAGASATTILDRNVPESIWPTLVRFVPPDTYEEPSFPRPNSSGGIDLVSGFTSGQPFEAFDSVGEISRQLMIGPIHRPGGEGPPWIGSLAESGETDVPVTLLIARTLTRDAADLPGDPNADTEERIMAARIDFTPPSIATLWPPWSWRLLGYLTTQSLLFDGADNDGDTFSDLDDPTEGITVLNRAAGRININTAPPSVLRSLPFMSLLPTSPEYTQNAAGGTPVSNPANVFTTNRPYGIFWDFASAIVARREDRPVSLRLWNDNTGLMQTVAIADRKRGGASPESGGSGGSKAWDPGPFKSVTPLLALTNIGDILPNPLVNDPNDPNNPFNVDRFWLYRGLIPLNEHGLVVDTDWSSPDFRTRFDSATSNGRLIDYIALGNTVPSTPPPPEKYDNGGIRGRGIYFTRWASLVTTRSDVFTAYIALMDEDGNYVHRSQVTLDRSDCFAEDPSDPLRRPILPRILLRQDGSYMDDTK